MEETKLVKTYGQINRAKKLIINDYRNYNPDKCRNGGGYAFFKTFIMLDNMFCYDFCLVFYDTTADFPYCNLCGNFHNWDHNCEYVKIIDRVEALSEIQHAYYSSDENLFVEESDDLWELETYEKEILNTIKDRIGYYRNYIKQLKGLKNFVNEINKEINQE